MGNRSLQDLLPIKYRVDENGLPAEKTGIETELVRAFHGRGWDAYSLAPVVDALDRLDRSSLKPGDLLVVDRDYNTGLGEMPVSQRPLRAVVNPSSAAARL